MQLDFSYTSQVEYKRPSVNLCLGSPETMDVGVRNQFKDEAQAGDWNWKSQNSLMFACTFLFL